MFWLVILASAVPPDPVPAPPLINSTVLGVAITTIGGIIVAAIGIRRNRAETAPSPPSTAGTNGAQLGPHDLEVATKLGAIESKQRRDFDRLNAHDVTARDHEERLRAIEARLGITPDPTRQTGGIGL